MSELNVSLQTLREAVSTLDRLRIDQPCSIRDGASRIEQVQFTVPIIVKQSKKTEHRVGPFSGDIHDPKIGRNTKLEDLSMKRLYHVFIVLCVLSITVVSLEVLAQSTPKNQAVKVTKVTFDKSDLLNAMTDAERKEFLEMREALKQLKKAKESKSLPPAVVEASAISFREKGKQFENKFGHLRGFKGKTVRVYGTPPPSKRDIMAQIINRGGIRGGGFGSGLPQHWTRDKSGDIVGSASPPKIETASNPVRGEFPEAKNPTVSSPTYGDNGCTHGIFGIPDDTPECRAAMGR